MKTRKGEVITRREIDVMGEEELLDLVRRHARLLGEQFPKQADRFYCPDILDESHLLRKLYRLDRERFVELVREQNKREYIAGGHWAAILISQGETLPEEVLRRQEQVMSKADAHCKLVLERLWNPGWPQRDFEEELKKVGLLISEAHPDWDSPKLAKLQRLALTRAMVCHYQWRAGELRSALAAAPKPEIFTALVWGVYQEDRLEKVFLLDGTGTAWGEDGAPFPLPDDAQVGLVVPAEMTKGQLALWKKRLKETGVKSPIRQLTIPPQLPGGR